MPIPSAHADSRGPRTLPGLVIHKDPLNIPWRSTNDLASILHGSDATGVMRGGIGTNGDVPALPFWNQSGTCASHSMVNDTGHCVDADDGNSFVAEQTIIDARQFNIPSHGVDGTAQAQKAINYAASVGRLIYFPRSFDYTSLLLPPGLHMMCGGPDNPIYRMAADSSHQYGMATTSAVGDAYPVSVIRFGPHIKNCTLDGQGNVGTNITIAQAERTVLEDFDTRGSGTAGAEANISITSNVMTVNTLHEGTIATGQVLLCKDCKRSNNRFATVGTNVDATHWNITGASDITSREAVFSPGWTYTDSLGTKTLPSAEATFLGGNINNLVYTRWERGVVGSQWTTLGEAAAVYSSVGILIDTTKTDGTETMNQAVIAPKEVSGVRLGLALMNGSDNKFPGISFQNDLYAMLIGEGLNGAGRNLIEMPYLESGGSATTYKGIVFANGAQFNRVTGTGALNAVTTPLEDTGFGNRWDQTTRVSIHSGDPVEPIVDTFYAGTTLANATKFNGVITNTFARLLDGPDEQHVTSNVMAYGTSHLSSFMVGRSRGVHGSQAAVQSLDILGFFGAYGQFSSTNGDMVEGFRIEPYATQNWSSGHTGTGAVFRVTPNDDNTLRQGAWVMDSDKSFRAFGLTAGGAGSINASSFYSANTAGVDCALTGATAHLTVKKGIVTACD